MCIMDRIQSKFALECVRLESVLVQNRLGFKSLMTDAASVCEHVPKVHAFNVTEHGGRAVIRLLSTQITLIPPPPIISILDHKLSQVLPIFYLTVRILIIFTLTVLTFHIRKVQDHFSLLQGSVDWQQRGTSQQLD